MISRPILLLQLKSNVCPCLLSQEERTVITSIQLLSKLHVVYHEPTAAVAANSDAGTLSSFSYPMTKSFKQLSGALHEKVGKFVSSGRFMEKQSELQHEENKDSTMANNKGVNPSLAASTTSRLGRLFVLDTVNGPALSMKCCSDSSVQQQQQQQCETMVIPLHTIAEVSPCDSFTSFSSSSSLSSSSCGIYLFAKEQHQHAQGVAVTGATSTNSDATPLRELCRLDLKHVIKNKNNHHDYYQDLDSTERDEIMEALTLLIQWSDSKGFWQLEQQPPNEQQEEEAMTTTTTTTTTAAGGGIGQRALKIKHFAQREIEMAKKKRERESRKARYLKESGGGLKYTAIAMANRQMS